MFVLPLLYTNPLCDNIHYFYLHAHSNCLLSISNFFCTVKINQNKCIIIFNKTNENFAKSIVFAKTTVKLFSNSGFLIKPPITIAFPQNIFHIE